MSDYLASLDDGELTRRIALARRWREKKEASAAEQPKATPPAKTPPGEGESASTIRNRQLATEVVGATPVLSAEQFELATEAAAHRLAEIAPLDPIEELLTGQMLALHAASMECARRAALPGQTDAGRQLELRLAAKLSRSFAGLVDTLNKHRRRGEQRVTVEHVHVHAGGQAVVGVVAPGGVPENG